MSQTKQANEGSVTLNQRATAGDREVKAKAYDEAAVAERMARLNDDIRIRKASEQAKAAALAKVPVKAEDVARVAAELGLPTAQATMKLQECGGDLERVFREYIGLPVKA